MWEFLEQLGQTRSSGPASWHSSHGRQTEHRRHRTEQSPAGHTSPAPGEIPAEPTAGTQGRIRWCVYSGVVLLYVFYLLWSSTMMSLLIMCWTETWECDETCDVKIYGKHKHPPDTHGILCIHPQNIYMISCTHPYNR